MTLTLTTEEIRNGPREHTKMVFRNRITQQLAGRTPFLMEGGILTVSDISARLVLTFHSVKWDKNIVRGNPLAGKIAWVFKKDRESRNNWGRMIVARVCQCIVEK